MLRIGLLPNGNASVICFGATLSLMNRPLGVHIVNVKQYWHASYCLLSTVCLIAPLWLFSLPAFAQLAPESRAEAPIIKYRTREEKREAGLTTDLTSWMRFQGVVESEVIREKVHFRENEPVDKADYVDPAVQFNFEFSVGEVFEAELILEYTEDTTDPMMEELILSWDIGDFGLSAGRYYVPFGEYFSNFINGPLIEFSQTRGDVLQLDYDYEDTFEVAAFLFDSRSERTIGSKITDNWGISFQAKLFDEHLLLGGGWLSNIADGDFRPLEDNNDRFLRTVPAWNIYLIAEWENLGLSFEQVEATRSFRELDNAENSPSAWNVEAAWYPSNTTEFAVRYERGSELADEAERQAGIQFTWRPANRFSLSLEYIRQDFRPEFVFDDDDREFKDGHIIAGSFSYIF